MIIGSIEKDVKNQLINKIAKDARIEYLGWKNKKSDEILETLAAADVYCQPGDTICNTTQCCKCKLLVNDQTIPEL